MGEKKIKILIVDDDSSMCHVLLNILEYEGYDVQFANSGKTGTAFLRKSSFDVALLDLKLPDIDGLDVLKSALDWHPDLQVIMISGQGTIDIALEATRIGAFDFLEKPLDSERVLVTLKNALNKRKLEKQKAHLLESVKAQFVMIGESPPMKQVQALILKAASSNSKVLIEGENGTGKELVARAIHMNSARSTESFVAVNCAAIPETLIESELFGHKKGAFTGATKDKPGRFQMADGGTIFLDEVGDMSTMTQAKVLRTLEENVVEMVGGSAPIPTDARVIAATNKNLQEEMQQNNFREDLYFRLNVLNIRVPPLRERKEDIPSLVEYYIQRFCQEHGIKAKQIKPKAMNRLVAYAWPGNVRELKNFVERLVFLVEASLVGNEDVSQIIRNHSVISKSIPDAKTLKEARLFFEKEYIREKLTFCDWNVTKTAELLGIPRTYLYKKINALGIET